MSEAIPLPTITVVMAGLMVVGAIVMVMLRRTLATRGRVSEQANALATPKGLRAA